MTPDDYIEQLEKHGFRYRETDTWSGVLSSDTDPDVIWPWLENQVRRLREKPGERGARYNSAPGPDEEPWFIKQYHRGGLFARKGDVLYSSTTRFLNELLATVRAGTLDLNVPKSMGVFWNKRERGYVGYFVSEFIDGQRVSRCLRNGEHPDLMRRIGETLAVLHEGKIDHTDYKVDNLLVDENTSLFVTDFDEAGLGPVSGWTRMLRVHRFYRFLSKHGLDECGEEAFLEGYRDRADDQFSSLFYHFQRPFLGLKNLLSDGLYSCLGRPLRPVHTEKLLIRAPNWVGDSVLSLPFLHALSEHLPESEVDVVCRDVVSDVYRACPDVRKTFTLSDEKTLSLPSEIERERYSMFLILPKSLRTAIQAWRSGIPRRRGFSTQGRSMFLTDRIPLNERDRTKHHARLYFDLLDELLPEPEELPSPRLDLKKDWRQDVPDDWIRTPYLTIHPGSAYGPAKRWPPERFNTLLQKIVRETEYRITAVGVESERDIADEVLVDLPEHRVLDLVGKTSLRQCMVVLHESRCTIANDSGIMHLSAALTTPLVAVFGSSSPDLTSPLGSSQAILYEGVPCSPCFEMECPLPEDRYRCLTAIEPEEVFHAMKGILSSRKQSGGQAGNKKERGR